MKIRLCVVAFAFSLLCYAEGLEGQGTLADYQRGHDVREQVQDLVVDVPSAANWIDEGHHFWYSKSVKGGTVFVLGDADAATKKPAFDQERLAVALSRATGHSYTALQLPFAPARWRPGVSPVREDPRSKAPLRFLGAERAIQFGEGGAIYTCSLTEYLCAKRGPITRADREGLRPAPEDGSLPSPEEVGRDPVDGVAYRAPAAQDDDGDGQDERDPRACAPAKPSDPLAESRRAADARPGVGSQILGQLPAGPHEVCGSFDGKYEAFVENFNVFVKPKGEQPAFPLSLDGSENSYYSLQTIAWSPDSTKLVAYRTRPGFDRLVTYIESSPADQIQPKTSTIHYAKPGDPVDLASPVLFDVASKQATEIDHALFPNPFELSEPVWWKDGRGFTFEYNQRGHQVYTVIEVDAHTAKGGR
jgi:hypothetical protein